MSISLCALSVHNRKLNSVCRPLVADNYRLIDFIYTSQRVLKNYSELDIALRRIHEVLHKDQAVISIADLDHIDVLCSFGMTPSIHNALKNAGLTTIHQLKQLSKKEYDEHLKRESNSIYKKTQNIIKKFESVFSNDYIDIISFLLICQHDVDKKVDVNQLIRTTEKFYSLAENKVYLTLNTLVDEGILIKENDTYYVKKWTLDEVLSFDFPHKDTYLMRLEGISVRDIGKETGVSRTSVLTYVSRINDHFIPHYLEENKYSVFLTEYNMPRSTFEYVFNLEGYVTDYLYCNFEVRDLNTNIEKIIEDNILKKDELNRLLYIEKKFVNHQGEILPQSSTNIFEEIVYRHRDESFTLKSFYKLYMSYLKHNDIINIKPTDIRRFESIIDESKYVVKSIKHEFRYFDINISTETIHKINEILKNLDGSYGLQFIFKNNKKALKEIGLRNGYELGSLINKVGLDKFENVNSIIRISTIQLGNRSHQQFVEDKISEFRERMLNTLLRHLQKDYGLHRDTMFTYISNQYVDYIFDGRICCDETLPVSRGFYKAAKEQLTEPVYFIADVMKDLSKIARRKLLPSKQLFHELGYTAKGSQIIYDSSYPNVTEAIKAWILSKEVLEADNSEIFKTQQWYAEIYDLERELLIFRLSPNEFVHYNYLKALGITKPMVEDFISEVKKFTRKYKYFTLPFLKNHGFNHELFNYLNDYTLERILATRNNIYPQSFSSPIIYTNDLSVQSKSEVLKDIYKKHPMPLEKMLSYLEKTYHLSISKVELKYRLSRTGVLIK